MEVYSHRVLMGTMKPLCSRLLQQQCRCRHSAASAKLRVSKLFPAVTDIDNVNVYQHDQLQTKTQQKKTTDQTKDRPNDGPEIRENRSISQKLMLQNVLIRGASSGSFHLLGQATRALEKLTRIIDREMKAIGGQKITMPCLAPAHQWKTSDRWTLMGSELFKLKDRHDSEMCLAPTHEEAVTSMVAMDSPVSYKTLPIMLYQIGRKFRDEKRPKNGLLRGREFEMKDLYTFDEDETLSRETYNSVCDAYDRIFQHLDLNYIKVQADTGAMGGSLSHEFHLPSEVGEDTLYTCSRCQNGFNKDLVELDGSATPQCPTPGCGPLDKPAVTAIEIAHAFILGTKYSSAFDALYVDSQGHKKPLYMGCFGIGVTRLLAASVEVLSVDGQLRWPRLLAPHQICIISQKEGHKCEVTSALADELYSSLSSLPQLHYEVVLDDRLHLSIGRRLIQAKQMGYPFAIAVGKKALEKEPLYECVDIYHGKTNYLTMGQIMDTFSKLETIPLL